MQSWSENLFSQNRAGTSLVRRSPTLNAPEDICQWTAVSARGAEWTRRISFILKLLTLCLSGVQVIITNKLENRKFTNSAL